MHYIPLVNPSGSFPGNSSEVSLKIPSEISSGIPIYNFFNSLNSKLSSINKNRNTDILSCPTVRFWPSSGTGFLHIFRPVWFCGTGLKICKNRISEKRSRTARNLGQDEIAVFLLLQGWKAISCSPAISSKNVLGISY